MLESNLKKLDPSLLRGLDKFKVKEDNVCPLKAEDIEDPDNEFWVLQCPKNLDVVNLLKDRKISLTGKTRLRLKDKTASGSKKHIKSKKYEIVGTSKQVDDSGETNDAPNINGQGENLIALLPGTEEQLKLVLAPLSGHIIVREYVEEISVPTLIAEPKTIHQLPPGIKERHPTSWQMLKDTFSTCDDKNPSSKKKKKGKSRKRRHSLIEVVEEDDDEGIQIQEEIIQIQEEEGGEEDITVIENVTIEDEQEEDNEPPRKKKKKKSKKEVEI